MPETSRPMVGKLSDNDGMIHKPYISRSSAKPAFIRHKYCTIGLISTNRKIGANEDEIRRITLDTNMTL